MLHGLFGSSRTCQIINENGALKMLWESEDQLRKAAKSAVCKINDDSDGRLAMTAAVKDSGITDVFDRGNTWSARESLKELYKGRISKSGFCK